MKYLITYNESIMGSLKGVFLLTSLLGVPNFAHSQTKRHQIEQKAELSRLDDISLKSVLEAIHSKGYEIYGTKFDLSGNNYLFTSSRDLRFSKALLDAKKDADVKIEYLGIKGDQLIFTNNIDGISIVIIITEIRDKNYKPLYNRDTDIPSDTW